MYCKKSIGSFNHRVEVQHLHQKIDEIGNPISQWLPIRKVWVHLKPIYNYRQRSAQKFLRIQANCHYRLTARLNISYTTSQGKEINIWHVPFRLIYQNFQLKPLDFPNTDPSKNWINVIVRLEKEE